MKDIKWIMFDADNTLLDFNKASKDALRKSFKDHGEECTEEVYRIYRRINLAVWRQFEEGSLSAEQLRIKRFHDLFEEIGKKLAEPGAFNKSYLESLVVCSELYVGVEEILIELQGQYKISLITNGLKEVQRPRLSRLGLNHYFDSIVVSDEIGSAKPDVAFFEYAYRDIQHEISKEEILVVGDNIVADVGGAQSFGCTTCWVSHGKENNTNIRPDHIIKNIDNFEELF